MSDFATAAPNVAPDAADKESTVLVARITVDNQRHALHIAETIVLEKLAATANVQNGHTAFRLENGDLAEYEEFAITAVTTTLRFDELCKRVSGMAGVVVPGITAYSLVNGHPGFSPWIHQVVETCSKGC